MFICLLMGVSNLEIGKCPFFADRGYQIDYRKDSQSEVVTMNRRDPIRSWYTYTRASHLNVCNS